MGTKMENLRKKSSEIAENKKVLSEQKEINSADQASIKELLDGFVSDEDDLSSISGLERALVSDAAIIDTKNTENEQEREETLSETDASISALEDNLSKLQEIERTTDLVRDSSKSESTKRRIQELEDIRSVLEGEAGDKSSDVGRVFIQPESTSFKEQRESFIEELKKNVEPQIKLTEEDKVISSIHNADKNELVDIVKNTGLSQNADFGNLDTKVAQEIVESVYNTKKEFPFISMNFIGSAQSRNRLVEEKLYNTYMEEYKKLNPTYSEDDLKPYVMEAVEKDMAQLSLDGPTIAQSIYVEDARGTFLETVSSVSGISINEAYGNDYDEFEKTKMREVLIGHKPIGCDTPKATIDHELGHQIANHLGANNDNYIKEIYAKFSELSEDEKSNVLSTYAGKNINEFIAECWSEYNNNPSCRKVAKAVSQRLIALKNANTHGEIGPRTIEENPRIRTTDGWDREQVHSSHIPVVEAENLVSALFNKIRSSATPAKLAEYDVDRTGFVKGSGYNTFIKDRTSTEKREYIDCSDKNITKYIEPSAIEGIHVSNYDMENPDYFWSQHYTGGTMESFKEVSKYIPEVQRQLDSGRSLFDLENDPILGPCACVYFDPKEMVRVIECDGYYEFESNGRHRILAARAIGQNIPVKIVGARKRK